MTQTIAIDNLVDEQKFGRFNINVLFWSFLAMFADGFDISALSFAAPELVREWHLDSASLGPAFSASLFGILFGAPLLGYFGDRYGRKAAIICGCLIYGLTTLALVATTSLHQLIVLRFFTGIGIGGLMPNTIALNTELAPRRLRATLTVLMFTGITLGGASPSMVAAWLIPHYGWHIMFIVGGIVPLVVAACSAAWLPESIKFLAQFPARRAGLLRVARRMRRDLALDEQTEIISPAVIHSGGTGLRPILGNGLLLITPLLWSCFATALMANYFIGSWMPIVFESNGITPERAALASGFYHVGGTLGGILVSILLDRFGFVVIGLLFLLACPAVACIGLPGHSFHLLTLATTLSGITVLGAQFGNNAAAGLIYPTAFRSKGVGWALAIGRFGSILGPLLGGWLISMHMSMQNLFLAAAAPMLLGTAAALLLTRLCYSRYGGLQLDDTPVKKL